MDENTRIVRRTAILHESLDLLQSGIQHSSNVQVMEFIAVGAILETATKDFKRGKAARGVEIIREETVAFYQHWN